MNTKDEGRVPGAPRRENRLADSRSPYLLQHKRNPVAWQPWDDEALATARREDKPIFLSIGYSSCHWCHVMEHESFENEAIAAFLNEHFVPIKVDREERPDLDEVYMKAVQLLTSQGGWPMSVFLTPGLEPFYGGTYFPPVDRYGRPGFLSVLQYLARAWREQRERCVESAAELRKHIAKIATARGERMALDVALLEAAERALFAAFDAENGGFGSAPKFPHPMDLALLLRREARAPSPQRRKVIETSLEKMARGGIYDQLGGGFHRYSVDERWLVPHFEKMLYDNALLLPVYAEAAVRLADSPHAQLYGRVARGIADYVLREMTSEHGAFFSATDADSEGEEGRYFVFTRDEILGVLGKKEGEAFAAFFGVTPGGNFEHGANVLEQVGDEAERPRFAAAIARLLELRRSRVAPGLDDKVLADWNGLMIAGLARAGAHLREPRYVAAAARAARFVLGAMRPEGRLMRAHRDGVAHTGAFLQDFACLAHGLLELAAVSPEREFLVAARELIAEARSRFVAEDGGFYSTAADQEAPLGRSRDPFDNATPSGNSVMFTCLLRLSEIEGDPALVAQAREGLESFASAIGDSPAGFGWMLEALDRALAPPPVAVIVGPESDAMVDALAAAARRGLADVVRSSGEEPAAAPLLASKAPLRGGATAYVCRDGTCQAPVTTEAECFAAVTRGGTEP
jgi:uncharacterized protein YyaL (SSP411 family)